jgi:hypothetical protein
MRTLLIHGARSVLHHAKDPGPWLAQIKERRPANVAKYAHPLEKVKRAGSPSERKGSFATSALRTG